MFEGHDTVSMAIIFALFCLANNPKHQEIAYQEQCQIFGNSDRVPTIPDLNEMRFLERCVKESLRLYPSVPLISRALTEPLVLKNRVIPAGQIVHIHIFDLHRDPDLFPDPERYDPDRFLPDECAKRHPFAYIPFSAGPRNCIGQRFAMYEDKSVISTVLRKYKLEAITKPEEIIFNADLVLRPKYPIKIRFRHRSKDQNNIMNKNK
uniref:Putative cytochrome n=1 Tax=Xenopsylla cheopis TaxID=163159 RepID=A0A6M2DZD7_XENCH